MIKCETCKLWKSDIPGHWMGECTFQWPEIRPFWFAPKFKFLTHKHDGGTCQTWQPKE